MACANSLPATIPIKDDKRTRRQARRYKLLQFGVMLVVSDVSWHDGKVQMSMASDRMKQDISFPIVTGNITDRNCNAVHVSWRAIKYFTEIVTGNGLKHHNNSENLFRV